MVTIRDTTEKEPGNTEQLHSHGDKITMSTKQENPEGVKDDYVTQRKPKRRKKLLEKTSDVYIQVKLLRGVVGYYQENNLYPLDNPISFQDFLSNWLQLNFLAVDFKELIVNLRLKFRSEDPGGNVGGDDDDDDDIKLLIAMVDYYITKRRYPFPEKKNYEDFYRNWNDKQLSLSECWVRINNLKRKHEIWGDEKKLVFSGIDDLLLFNLSEIMWGSEEDLSQVETELKILAAMVDYYFTKCRYPYDDTTNLTSLQQLGLYLDQ